MNIAEITASEKRAKLDAALAKPVNTIEDDPCCSRALAKQLRQHPEFQGPWECPKCGSEWRPITVEAVRHWTAHSYIEVIR